MITKKLVCLAVVFCWLLPSALAQSQLGTGTISGSVQDEAGAIIAGANVTITNIGTGLTRTLTTNSSGQFNAPVLPAGEYTVKVEQQGFAVLDQKGLIVNVGSTLTLKLEMK